jgi:hypothetical protein
VKDDEDGDCGPSQIFRCVCGSERRTNIFANARIQMRPVCRHVNRLFARSLYRVSLLLLSPQKKTDHHHDFSCGFNNLIPISQKKNILKVDGQTGKNNIRISRIRGGPLPYIVVSRAPLFLEPVSSETFHLTGGPTGYQREYNSSKREREKKPENRAL